MTDMFYNFANMVSRAQCQKAIDAAILTDSNSVKALCLFGAFLCLFIAYIFYIDKKNEIKRFLLPAILFAASLFVAVMLIAVY